MSKIKGRLIVFEGTDGCGKSNMITKINNYLSTKKSLDVQIHAFPNGEFDYSYNNYLKIREILKDPISSKSDILQYMIISNMRMVFNNTIEQEIKEGKIVLLDRWLLSTIVYNAANKGQVLDAAYCKINDVKNIKRNYQDIDRKIYMKDFSDIFAELPIYPDKVFTISIHDNLLIDHSNWRNKHTKNKEIFDQSDSVLLHNNLYKQLLTKNNYTKEHNLLNKYNIILEKDIYSLIRPDKDYEEYKNENEIYKELERKIIDELDKIF